MRAVLTAILLTAATQASAQVVCADHEAILSQAESTYGQVPALQMTDMNGQTVLFLVNPTDESWTIAVDHGAQTCVYSWGTGFGPAPQGEAL